MDKRISYQQNDSLKNALELKTDAKTHTNKVAFAYLLIYNPGFFVVLLCIEMLIRHFFHGFHQYLILLIYLWVIILLLSPLARPNLKRKNISQI